MGLYLFESALQDTIKDEAALSQAVEQFEAAQADVELIEVQVAQNFERAFLIVETDQEGEAKQALEASGFPVSLAKEVRIVGQDLDHVKAQKEKINYLVEWNLPENLTMDQYLERKKKNSVHYQEVPEVSFSRTYVCEDMTKCLCFYDAPDDEAVVRAREAVKAPIDAITELNPNKK